MLTITEQQLKNDLDGYLDMASSGETIIVTKSGQEICELGPRPDPRLTLFDSLTGIAESVDVEIRDERVMNSYYL